MRYLFVITILLVIGPVLYAAETSVGLDRCVVLNDATNQDAESMVAIYFDIPDTVLEKEIIYAELNIPFSVQAQNDSSHYELMLYPATGTWSEETIDYEEAVDIADSLIGGAYTIRLTGQSEFHIDITDFVREVVEEERTNYGLIAATDLLGDNNLRLPTNIGGTIRNSASVGIVYR